MTAPPRSPLLEYSAPIGAFLIFPGLYFAAAAILKAYAGIDFFFLPVTAIRETPGWRDAFDVLSPLVFLGGPLLALALNALRLIRIDIYRYGSGLRGTFTVGFRRANAAVAGTAIGLGLLLFTYALIENLGN
jgi:hypothetical protein